MMEMQVPSRSSSRELRLSEHYLRAHWKRRALKRQGGKCLYCWMPLKARHATADHINPIAYGGQTLPDNIDALCRACNSAKGKTPKAQFIRMIERPDFKNDYWPKYLYCMEIRLKRRTSIACERIKGMFG